MDAIAGSSTGSWSGRRSAAGRTNRWVVAIIVSIPTFMDFLDISIANVSLFQVAGSFGVAHDQASWMLSSYVIAQAVMTTMSGWFMQVLGRKFYYMLSVAIFTASSVTCAMAPSLSALVVARIVQGIGGGGLASTEMSILVDTFPPQERSKVMGLYAMTLVVAPILGPLLGGYLTDTYGWQSIFLINVPVGLVSLVLLQFFVLEARVLKFERALRWANGLSLDWLGFLLIVSGAGSLELVLSRGQSEDWFNSSFICWFAVVAVVSVALLVMRERRVADPVLNVRLFGSRAFSTTIALLLINGLLLGGGTLILPRMLQQLESYTAMSAGFVVALGATATISTIPIASLVAGKVQPRVILACAFALQALAFWHMTGLTTDVSFWLATSGFALNGLVLPFTAIPLLSTVHADVPEENTAAASAIAGMSRHFGFSIGIALVETGLARQDNFNRVELLEHLNPYNAAVQSKLQQIVHVLVDRGQTVANATQQAWAVLYGVAQQQAAMLAYIDTYWLLAECAIAAVPLTLLLKKANRGMR